MAQRYFWICTVGLFLLACGAQDKDGPSKLNDLRILGLVTETPEFKLASLIETSGQALEVSAIDFHPGDIDGRQIDRLYVWQLCFSLGALAKFECLAEDKVVEMTTDSPSMDLTLDAATLLALIPEEFLTAEQSPFSTMMTVNSPPDEVCPEGLGVGCSVDDDCPPSLSCSSEVCEPVPATSPVPLIVRVTVSSADEQTVTAARTIGLRFAGELNQNPQFGEFEIGMGRLDAPELTTTDDDCVQLGPFDAAVLSLPIKATFEESSLQAFPYVDEGRCREGDEFESAFVSWYSSSGTFDNQVITTDYSDNKLKFESATAETVRVYASLRDGRNGLAMSCFEFERVVVPQ